MKLCFFSSQGARRVQSKRPRNYQEEAEGDAEGPGEAGKTAGEKRERGSTQWETAGPGGLCLLIIGSEFHPHQSHEITFACLESMIFLSAHSG